MSSCSTYWPQPYAGTDIQKYFYDLQGNLDCVARNEYTGTACLEAENGTQANVLLADYGYDYLNRLQAFRSYEITTTNGTPTSSGRSGRIGRGSDCGSFTSNTPWAGT